MRVPFFSERNTNMSRTTLWRAKKRGWYCPNYRKKGMYPGNVSCLNIPSLLQYAIGLYWKWLWWDEGQNKDDCVQEGMLRIIEICGHPKIQDNRFQASTILNAMRDFLARYGACGSRRKWLAKFEEKEEQS